LPNRHLAKAYFTVAAQSSASWDTYITIRNRLAECSIDIAAEYEEHGSLKKFKVPGIGAKTKGILESILEKGIIKARNSHVTKKDEAIQKQFFAHGRPQRESDPDYTDRGLTQEQGRDVAHKASEEFAPE